jgi:hypothetical protein
MHGASTSLYFVPSLPYVSTGGFGVHWEITRMCSKQLCLHVEQRVSGAEEGGSQVMRNTENFFMLCFISSQLGAGQGDTSP